MGSVLIINNKQSIDNDVIKEVWRVIQQAFTDRPAKHILTRTEPNRTNERTTTTSMTTTTTLLHTPLIAPMIEIGFVSE